MKRKKEKRILLFLLVILSLIWIGIYFYTDIFKGKDLNTPKVEEKTGLEILEEKGIKIVNKEQFENDANKLLEKGYSVEEVNQIFEWMSDENQKKILEKEYQNLSDFFRISNFNFDLIDRYKAYQSLEGIEMADAVTRVNLNLDEPFYKTIEQIEQPEEITALVNKSHALPKDYEPTDLEAIPSFPNLLLRNVAIENFEKLLSKALLDGISLIPYSTYRSYDYQDGLYNKYLQTDTKEEVDTYSARPGHSEHQTGLAIDIKSASHWYNLTDNDYEWMKNNSYQFGFIIRYPKDNSFITGYKEEPWHIRYIGIEHATKVHELGITYDEYYDLYLTKH